MARKRSSKGTIKKAKPAAKKKLAAKPAPKKAAAKRKVAPQRGATAKPMRTPPPPTLLDWENQLRDPSLLPAIRDRVTTIVSQLTAPDHNRGPVTVIDEYVEGLIDELTSPSASHSDEMRRYMNRIVELEPSISPDMAFREIPSEPDPNDDYPDAMCEQFLNAWKLTWDIYERMGGTDQPTPPSDTLDAGGKIVAYAKDILKCVNEIHPGFLAVHRRKQSK